jgi:hypothetical protein
LREDGDRDGERMGGEVENDGEVEDRVGSEMGWE